MLVTEDLKLPVALGDDGELESALIDVYVYVLVRHLNNLVNTVFQKDLQ